MKLRNIFDRIAERFHYIILISITAALNINSFSGLSEFMTGVTVVYIVIF